MRLRVNASVWCPSATKRDSSIAVSTLADARVPVCASINGRCHTAKLRSACGEPSSSIASTGSPHSRDASSAGLPIVALVKQKVGLGAVVLAQTTQPPQHVRHVAAEHPPQRVQLVDDDVAQAQEERRPARVRRQDPHVQHLGVGEHDVGVVADPRPLVERGVAVVRRGHEVGDQPLAEGAQLVLGEGLGGEDEQRRVAPTAGDRLDDRHLVAERLARSRAGRDRDVAPVAKRVDGLSLVRPEGVDAPAAQAGVHEGREGGRRPRRDWRPAPGAPCC